MRAEGGYHQNRVMTMVVGVELEDGTRTAWRVSDAVEFKIDQESADVMHYGGDFDNVNRVRIPQTRMTMQASGWRWEGIWLPPEYFDRDQPELVNEQPALNPANRR